MKRKLIAIMVSTLLAAPALAADIERTSHDSNRLGITYLPVYDSQGRLECIDPSASCDESNSVTARIEGGYGVKLRNVPYTNWPDQINNAENDPHKAWFSLGSMAQNANTITLKLVLREGSTNPAHGSARLIFRDIAGTKISDWNCNFVGSNNSHCSYSGGVLSAITLDTSATVNNAQLQVEGIDTTSVIFDDLGLVINDGDAATEEEILLSFH